MSHFDEALAKTILAEGVFSDDPNDRGGKTKYGITEAVARAHGYQGPMEEMTKDMATAIYRQDYWEKPKLPVVASIYPEVAYEMFDSGVNVGVGQVAKWLQQALNVLNNEATLYADMPVDGEIGPGTLAALQAYAAKRGADGGKVLRALLNAYQAVYYTKLCEVRPVNERYVYGWILKRVVGE